MSVLRRAYVQVLPELDGFDRELLEKLRSQDPGSKAGRQVGGQLNRALKRLHLDPIDLKVDAKTALASIKETEARLLRLSQNSPTVDVKIRIDRGLSELARFKKQLGDVGGDAGPGPSFGKSLISGIGDAAAAVRPILLPALAGVAVAASPLIGAAIAGAVVGAAGVGGVAGGLALAARDPRVKAAAANLGQEVMSGLTTRAEVFIDPALQGVEKVRSAWQDFDGDLKRIFDSSAGFVAPLIDGLLSGALKVGKGFADAVVSARPVIDQLGRTFDQVGGAVGNVFTTMADHADEGAMAIRDLTSATVDLINGINDVVGPLATVYGWLSKANGAFKDFTGGVSFLETLSPLEPLKLLYDGLKQVTGNSNEGAKSLFAWHGGALAVASAASTAAVTTEDVSAAQKRLTDVQGVLTAGLSSLGGATTVASQRSAALATAMDNLYGAAIRNTDANEAYQASWDSLTSSVSTNGRTLNIHTAAGRANRDALEGLLTSTNELYVADIAAGVSIAAATKKHEARIVAVKEEARRVGLNKQATSDLIGTYGQIPKKKTTDLVVSGVNAIVAALKDLYVFQRALADGIPIASEIAKLKGEKGPAHKYGGYAAGGQIGGWSPNSKADNIPAMLTAKEWVHPVDAVDYYGPQIMGAIQKRQVPREVLAGFATGALGKLGDLPFFATGGQVAPIDTSRAMRIVTDAGRTRVPSRAEVESKVPIGSGPGGAFARAQNGKPYIWASAGPVGYDCSGIVSAVYNVLHGHNPYSHTFSTGSLPGGWFTKPGIGGPLTAAWSNPGESPASSTTGHMMGMVNGLTFESSGSRGVHLGASTRRLSDFAHIAHYNRGGQVPFASYDSGGYLPPGISLAHNGTGRPEPVGGGNTYVFNFSGPVASRQAAKTMVLGAIKELKSERKLP